MYVLKIHYFDSSVVLHYAFDSLFRLLKFIWYIYTKNNKVSSIQVFKEV